MTITIQLSTDNAKLLAKALRCLDGNATDETLNALSEFGFDIGAILGMTTDSDDSDEIDELPNGVMHATVDGHLIRANFD